MSTIQAALWISLISLIVLFASCFVLWGLMALLARIPGPKVLPGEDEMVSEEDVPTLADGAGLPEKDTQRKQRAAAAAVAVALAVRSSHRVMPVANGDYAAVSAWKAVGRASSVSQRNGIYSRKTRG